MLKQKQAFTLVELIVVITILAILGTIAFISLQGYSKDARNSTRISDTASMDKVLELYQLKKSKYPLPDNPQEVTYQSDILRSQGTFGEEVLQDLGNLISEAPVDPLYNGNYIYSVTSNGKDYEILTAYEGDDLVTNTFLQEANADSILVPKLTGSYNGVFVKSTNYIVPTPSIINAEIVQEETLGTKELGTDIAFSSQVVTGEGNIPALGDEEGGNGALTIGTLTGVLLSGNLEDDKESIMEAIESTYTGSSIANAEEIDYVLNGNRDKVFNYIVLGKSTSSNTSNGGGKSTPIGPLISETDCDDALWYWIDKDLDTMGDGFCISPRIEGNGDTSGISWNDTGTNYGWNSVTTGGVGLADIRYGVTSYLSDYTCGALNTGYTDVQDYGDTMKGRMKWLSQYANTSNNYNALNNIDWIDITINTSQILPIPSIYIADCIDGKKDLTTDMILGEETITWNDYISETETRTPKNKYLLGWAYESGSHLPSAFSNIDAELVNNIANNSSDRGEYQVACEASLLTDVDDNNEWIWTSAIGNTSGVLRGRIARFMGYGGCGDQDDTHAGHRGGDRSARFVVRP